MASLRPAKCYRRVEKPYTRQSQRKPRKGYVKGVPDPKIHKFEVGDPKKKFTLKLYLISNDAVQIRHNALEASRISLNKALTKHIGKDAFFMKILVYPHHVLRENPLATGAGADRFQTGMRKAFGKPIGTAAQVRVGQKLIEVRVNKEKEAGAKKALKITGSKLPVTYRIVLE